MLKLLIDLLEGMLVLLGLILAVSLFAWFYNSKAWQKIASYKDTIESVVIILVVLAFCFLIGSGVDFF